MRQREVSSDNFLNARVSDVDLPKKSLSLSLF